MNQMAVLYRSHFHALELQLELTRRNIPFSITSGIRFFEQAHIKDVAAYLKLLTNPRDELAFKRIVQLLPGVGAKGADKLWLQFSPSSGAQSPDAAAHSRSHPTRTRCAAARPLRLAATRIQSLQPARRSEKSRRGLGATHRHHLPTGIQPARRQPRQDDPPGARSRLRGLLEGELRQLPQPPRRPRPARHLRPAISRTVEEFLAQLALLTNVEAEADRPPTTTTNRSGSPPFTRPRAWSSTSSSSSCFATACFPPPAPWKTPTARRRSGACFTSPSPAPATNFTSPSADPHAAGPAGDSMQQPSRFLAEIPRIFWKN